MNEKSFLIALHESKIGARAVLKLLDFFNSPQEAWNASPRALKEVLEKRSLEKLLVFRKQVDPAIILETLDKSSVKTITWLDECYPIKLKEIYDPPPVLYTSGNLKLDQEYSISIVGARRATYYGKKVAEMLGRELSSKGVCVVSGMARGIDSSAHLGALKAGGKTIAVLGCGLDVVYPRENKELMRHIEEKGAVVSEYALGTPPQAKNFPARNRIISGLTMGTVIVEAAAKSGALITADFALEQGREVFSVPGPITSPYSIGTNTLIKFGAKPVLSIEDILEETSFFRHDSALTSADKKKHQQLSMEPEKERLLQFLAAEPVHIDVLVQEMESNPQGSLSDSFFTPT